MGRGLRKIVSLYDDVGEVVNKSDLHLASTEGDIDMGEYATLDEEEMAALKRE
jgi:hypothetical protein